MTTMELIRNIKDFSTRAPNIDILLCGECGYVENGVVPRPSRCPDGHILARWDCSLLSIALSSFIAVAKATKATINEILAALELSKRPWFVVCSTCERFVDYDEHHHSTVRIYPSELFLMRFFGPEWFAAVDDTLRRKVERELYEERRIREWMEKNEESFCATAAKE